jgi:hypothetical protein
MNLGQEMDGYIIQWANDFFYKDCAYRAAPYPRDKDRTKTFKVLENGIKDTQGRGKNHGDEFEWHTRAVIDNGVKEVLQSSRVESNSEVIGEVIEKGIKDVNNSESIHRKMRAENLVPRIIKDVKPNRVIVHNEKMDRFYYDPNCRANKTEIWRIVEEVKPNIEYSKQTGVYHPDCVANHVKIEKVIEEGVKKIYPDTIHGEYDWSDEFKADNVIQGGIKVIPLPTIKDLRGYSDYYNTKEDRTKPHTEYVKDAIEGGTKL